MPRDTSGPLRAIAEQIEVPYDRTADGKPITVWMDVLECGHRMQSAVQDRTQVSEGGRVLKMLDNRHCKTCPKEGS